MTDAGLRNARKLSEGEITVPFDCELPRGYLDVTCCGDLLRHGIPGPECVPANKSLDSRTIQQLVDDAVARYKALDVPICDMSGFLRGYCEGFLAATRRGDALGVYDAVLGQKESV